jgi:signal transduction histidine kinase
MRSFYQILGTFLYSLGMFTIKIGSIFASQRHIMDWVLADVFLQIALTVCMQVVHGRTLVNSIRLKKEKSDTRLNILQYVSHEIRTPLNTVCTGEMLITTTAHKLKENLHKLMENYSNFPEEILVALNSCSEFVDSILETAVLINESCRGAVDTLNEALIFDQIDENMMPMEMKPVDPMAIVSDAIKPIFMIANQSHVRLFLDNNFEEMQGCLINADKFKMNQVLRNLLVNAIKFTPADGEVKVFTGFNNTSLFNSKGDPIPSLRITVSDTGCGIAKENQSTLFKKYVQFNANNLHEGKGIGLGLWISNSKFIFVLIILIYRYLFI